MRETKENRNERKRTMDKLINKRNLLIGAVLFGAYVVAKLMISAEGFASAMLG